MPIIKAHKMDKGEPVAQNPERELERAALPQHDEIDRILNIQLDAVVILAQKEMSVNDLLKLKHGSVIEFEKSVKEPLTLELNGKPVALGSTVKIVERFGLQVTEVVPVEAKVKAMK